MSWQRLAFPCKSFLLENTGNILMWSSCGAYVTFACWVLSGSPGVLPQSKDTHGVSLTDDCQLAVGVNASVSGALFWPCDSWDRLPDWISG